MANPNNLHITHYWILHNPHTDRWCTVQKARDVFGVHYSISGGTRGLRVVTAAEAAHVNRTGNLAQPQESDNGT